MFVKRKTSRPTRERAVEDEDEDENASVQDSPATLASRIKKRSKPKVKSRLSFGGEEDKDEDAFKIKKSKRASLVMGEGGVISNTSSNRSPLNLSTPISASASSQERPSYSREYLQELKAATPSSASRPSTSDYEEAETGYVESSSVLSIDEAGEVILPTQQSIESARSKRTQLRSHPELQQQAEEFVSLDLSTHVSSRERESRLVREEDELGDAEDEQAEYTGAAERIALGRKGRQVEKQKTKIGMAEMIEDAQMEDENDEESLEWEREQVRRATAQLERQDISGKPKDEYKPAPIPPAAPLPSLGPAIDRLTSILMALTTSHSASTQTMGALSAERQTLEEKETQLRNLVGEAEAKRGWFEDMSSKTEDLGAFLDAKFPVLEDIEKDHLSFIRERGIMVSKRLLLEDADDLSAFLGVPNLPRTPKGDDADDQDGEHDNDDDMSAEKQRQRFASREDRRNHRMASRVTSGKDAEDGYESPIPLDTVIESDFQDAVSRLSARVDKLMSDVQAKDYKDPSKGIAIWFADWRATYGDSYRDAWGGLGLVAAWEFWARLESCGWDPISSVKPLDSFKWFGGLYNYSQNISEREQAHVEDQDLASSMVATMFAPRLCAFIENGAFNPYSSTHVRRLIDLCEEVEVYVRKDDIKHKAILQSVSLPFRQAIDSTELLLQSGLESTKPLVRGAFPYPKPEQACRRFINRRLKLLLNLLMWRKHVGDLFGLGNLIGQLVEKLFLPVITKMNEVEGNVLKRRLLDTVPPELLPLNFKKA